MVKEIEAPEEMHDRGVLREKTARYEKHAIANIMQSSWRHCSYILGKNISINNTSKLTKEFLVDIDAPPRNESIPATKSSLLMSQALLFPTQL